MKKTDSHTEIELEILRNLDSNPDLTQRQIAEKLGVSLGKTNYLIKALLAKGLVKVNNFKRSNNKLGYMYMLTPKGIEKKTKLTILFLQRKSEEYNKLKQDIENLIES